MSRPRVVLRRGSEIAPGYRIVARLSRARTLDVYDVWSEERGCRCVAKTLRPDRRDDRAARRRLLREGRLLRRLAHPHIVRAYEVVDGPVPVVVMETLGGETLQHLLARAKRRLAARDIRELGLQLCAAVGYLHRHGILHLDLKPSNIIVEAGRIKLIDLSVARPPGRARKPIGTWCYLAPEQAGGGPLTAAADVWGIGMVLYEAATGQPVFSDDDPRDYPQLEERIPPVGRTRRLPPRLAGAIDACLEPDSGARPALADLAGTLAAGATRPNRPRR
jgi:serine/threonine protein kinase